MLIIPNKIKLLKTFGINLVLLYIQKKCGNEREEWFSNLMEYKTTWRTFKTADYQLPALRNSDSGNLRYDSTIFTVEGHLR